MKRKAKAIKQPTHAEVKRLAKRAEEWATCGDLDFRERRSWATIAEAAQTLEVLMTP